MSLLLFLENVVPLKSYITPGSYNISTSALICEPWRGWWLIKIAHWWLNSSIYLTHETFFSDLFFVSIPIYWKMLLWRCISLMMHWCMGDSKTSLGSFCYYVPLPEQYCRFYLRTYDIRKSHFLIHFSNVIYRFHLINQILNPIRKWLIIPIT